MDKIVEELSKIGIIPVVVIEDTEKAVPLAKALCEGGLPAAEVTFRTAAAKDAIEAMCIACPEMIVGAGTVLTVKQAEDALAAGAKFIVSPNFDEAVVNCVERERSLMDENTESDYKTIATTCEVTRLTDDQRAAFKDSCNSVYDWFNGVYTDIDLQSYIDAAGK